MDKILSNFAERLEGLLFEHEISPAKLSSEIGISEFEIYHWKSGKRKWMPSVGNIIKLADYFHCSIDFLLGLVETNYLKHPLTAPNFSKRFKLFVYESGWDFSRLAKAVHMSTTSFYDWINDKREPSIFSLVAISEAMKCTIDLLLGREEDSKRS